MVDRERFQTLGADELYRKLALGEPIIVLDVRTTPEYSEKHIPGSVLVPLQQLQSQWKRIPNSGTPIAVVSQSGMRALSACRFLAELDVGPLYKMEGGLTQWNGPTAAGLDEARQHRFGLVPSSFLVENYGQLEMGLALDLAMGEGRNAIYLAARGFDVDGVDVNSDTVARARVSARRLGVPIRAVVGNVEDGTYIIPIEAYDVIMVFNFLHRPLFPDIREGVKPGGAVMYETFTEQQREFGRPRNPDYLLESGELKRVFSDWEILRYSEGVEPESPGGRKRAVARILARKPAEG